MTHPGGDIYHDLITDAVAGQTDPLEGQMPAGRVLRRQFKLRFAKMLQQETLAEAIPTPPAPGESIHAISNGKYDFATWIPQMVDWVGTADCLYCSTWTLSRPNADDIFALHDAGRIAKGQIHLLTGLYFKRRETATYNYLLDGLLKRGGRYKAFRNHAKVLLIANNAQGFYLTVEGSANLNANPRLEQYCLTNDRKLYEFHRGWMEEVFASTTTQYRSTTTAREKNEFRGYPVYRAGNEVLVVSKHHADKDALERAKLAPMFDMAAVAKWADALAVLIRNSCPRLSKATILTPPPQGRTWPQPYFAGLLCQNVAQRLKRRFVFALSEGYTYTGPPVAQVIVVDDLILSGHTMRQAIQAVETAGIPVRGFAYYGA